MCMVFSVRIFSANAIGHFCDIMLLSCTYSLYPSSRTPVARSALSAGRKRFAFLFRSMRLSYLRTHVPRPSSNPFAAASTLPIELESLSSSRPF